MIGASNKQATYFEKVYLYKLVTKAREQYNTYSLEQIDFLKISERTYKQADLDRRNAVLYLMNQDISSDNSLALYKVNML
jgi:hypothetical protein